MSFCYKILCTSEVRIHNVNKKWRLPSTQICQGYRMVIICSPYRRYNIYTLIFVCSEIVSDREWKAFCTNQVSAFERHNLLIFHQLLATIGDFQIVTPSCSNCFTNTISSIGERAVSTMCNHLKVPHCKTENLLFRVHNLTQFDQR